MSTIPIFSDIKEVYGEQLGETEERYSKLLAAFAEAHEAKSQTCRRVLRDASTSFVSTSTTRGTACCQWLG